MGLTLLPMRTLADAKGVAVGGFEEGVDLGDKERTPTYGVLDMLENNNKQNMVFDSLYLICGNPRAVDYFDLPEAEQERYDQCVEANYAKYDMKQS